jgi:hypothetical protein
MNKIASFQKWYLIQYLHRIWWSTLIFSMASLLFYSNEKLPKIIKSWFKFPDDLRMSNSETRIKAFYPNHFIIGIIQCFYYYYYYRCSDALGMKSGTLSDSSITASESQPGYGPEHARLDNSQGWYTPERSSSQDFLQIDTGSLHYITKVATQVCQNVL